MNAGVWWVSVGFGVAAIVALAVLYRRASAARELEEAERVLADAYREPDNDERGGGRGPLARHAVCSTADHDVGDEVDVPGLLPERVRYDERA
jgi:hypothetical protein